MTGRLTKSRSNETERSLIWGQSFECERSVAAAPPLNNRPALKFCSWRPPPWPRCRSTVWFRRADIRWALPGVIPADCDAAVGRRTATTWSVYWQGERTRWARLAASSGARLPRRVPGAMSRNCQESSTDLYSAPIVTGEKFGTLLFCSELYLEVRDFIRKFGTLFSGYKCTDDAVCLLHRDAFGQVARFVDVAAAGDGDVVGQQLQRQHRQQREKRLQRRRQGNQLVDLLGDGGVAFRRQG